MDGHVLAGRALGAPWRVIAAELRVGRNAVIERSRRLGVAARRLAAPVATAPAAMAPAAEPHDLSDRRLPLPPGDPASWGALAALTPSIEPGWPGLLAR